ncbi:hypothetical protein AGMMS50212_00680 [Spirochaetia bacterium]|nr:hypothetical protein AGMMS50212_00680 [Spirochaetia bacterium]
MTNTTNTNQENFLRRAAGIAEPKSLRSIIFTLILTLFTLIGCRPSVEITNPINYYPGMNSRIDWPVVFKSYWNAMNNNYLFWDIDPTDWDAVYDTYDPKFASMGISSYTDSDIYDKCANAYTYFKEMTANLVDGHYGLSFVGGLLKETDIIEKHPKILVDYYKEVFGEEYTEQQILDKLDRKPSDFPYQINGLKPLPGKTARSKANEDKRNRLFQEFANSGNVWAGTVTVGSTDFIYNADTMLSKYFPTDKASAANTDNLGNVTVKFVTGKRSITGGGHILYFYFSAFALRSALPTPTDPTDPNYPAAVLLSNVLDKEFKNPDLKGVVVDIRGNGGGALPDLSLFWGCFINAPHTFAYTKQKAGAGRLDYTEDMPFRIFPAPESDRVANDVKIALIVDRYSISCAEISAMIVKTMPGREHRVFGERTFGGTSPLVDHQIGYVEREGGITTPFAPAFWKQIYTPYAVLKCADGNVYEGKGVPPDVTIESDEAYWTDFAAGTDKRLDEAIGWIEGN